jgi:polyvinyl alcohol dehydrogenase (cytochrome)
MRDRARRVPRRHRVLYAGVAVLAVGAVLAGCRPNQTPSSGNAWTSSGYDLANSRNAAAEKKISAANVSQLKQKWVIDAKGDVSATPAVKDGVVYFPDFGGYLTAADANTGQIKWQKKIADYTGNPEGMSRNTPVFYGNNLIIGEIKHHSHGEGGADDHSGGGTDDHSGGTDDHGVAATAVGDEHGDHDDHGTPAATTTTMMPGMDHGTPTTATTAAPGPTTTAAPGATTTTMAGGDHHGAEGCEGEEPERGLGGSSTCNYPAHLMAIDTRTGNLVWKTAVDDHGASMITANPQLVGERVVVGVSSAEEDFAQSNDYKCCTFRGSIVSVNARTGALLWKTYTVPPNPTKKACEKYNAETEEFGGCATSGVAVWNTGAVDARRNTYYVGTGNNYTVDDKTWECARAAKAASEDPAKCLDPANLIESILALDLTTGRIKWQKRMTSFDAWNYQCLFNPGVTWCPGPNGQDSDFGGNTQIFTATINGRQQELVGAGQKNGIYWALNPDTGEVVWHTLVGPGSFLGGIEWGSGFDGKYVYTAIANISNTKYNLTPSGQEHDGGSWAALDKATGQIVWQTPTVGAKPYGAFGAPTIANGVVYGGSVSPTGDNMFAMDANTGQILWKFGAAGSVNSSPSVVNGTVFWGSGYGHLAPVGMAPGAKLYAFSV